jgi:dynactin-4
MSREVLYHCSHSETPHAPLPPSHASSYADLSPLSGLFFCEECDAIRCDQCVAVEVASYYCPNCLFDVPSANVRADKNR